MIWLLVLLTGCAEPTAEEICEEQTSCPDLEYLNCMPVVDGAIAPYCESECLDYLETECELDVVW